MHIRIFSREAAAIGAAIGAAIAAVVAAAVAAVVANAIANATGAGLCQRKLCTSRSGDNAARADSIWRVLKFRASELSHELDGSGDHLDALRLRASHSRPAAAGSRQQIAR